MAIALDKEYDHFMLLWIRLDQNWLLIESGRLIFQQFFCNNISMKETKKTTGRPERRSIDIKFIRILTHKKKVIMSQANLLMSLYNASPDLRFVGGKMSKRLKQKLQVTPLQIKAIQIGSLNGKEKQSIIQLFDAIADSFQFEEFNEKTMPIKFYSDPFDLSFVFFKIVQEETHSQQISVEQQIFLCLLCLWKSQDLNKQLLNYFKQYMKFIIKSLSHGGSQAQDSSDMQENQIQPEIQEQIYLNLVEQIQNSYANGIGHQSEIFSGIILSQQLLNFEDNQIMPEQKQNNVLNQTKKHKKISKQVKHKDNQKKAGRGKGKGKVKGSKKGRKSINKSQLEQENRDQDSHDQQNQNPQKSKKEQKKQQKEAPEQLAINFCKYISYCYEYAKLAQSKIIESIQK